MVSESIHPQAICEAADLGDNATIGAFSHVFPGAVIGRDASIGEQVLVGGSVVIGDRVTVSSGVHLLDPVDVHDSVFIGPNVTFTSDTLSSDLEGTDGSARTSVEDGASIAGGAVILSGVRIGRNAKVGAGAVVTRDVPPFAIVSGNPAKVRGYIDDSGRKLGTPSLPVAELPGIAEGGHLIHLSSATDMRGDLVAVEFEKDLPFVTRRFFLVHGVPSRHVRGEHAHYECEQVLVCVNGSVRAIVDDGVSRSEYLLDHPSLGLYMPKMTWGTQYAYSPDAVLAVFASHPYDAADYIRDYSLFLSALGSAE